MLVYQGGSLKDTDSVGKINYIYKLNMHYRDLQSLSIICPCVSKLVTSNIDGFFVHRLGIYTGNVNV